MKNRKMLETRESSEAYASSVVHYQMGKTKRNGNDR